MLDAIGVLVLTMPVHLQVQASPGSFLRKMLFGDLWVVPRVCGVEATMCLMQNLGHWNCDTSACGYATNRAEGAGETILGATCVQRRPGKTGSDTKNIGSVMGWAQRDAISQTERHHGREGCIKQRGCGQHHDRMEVTVRLGKKRSSKAWNRGKQV
jgi:hypothetical protein